MFWLRQTETYYSVFLQKLVVSLASIFLAGCVANSAVGIKAPSADLSALHVLHVRHFSPDGRAVDSLIAKELRRMGFQASYGEIEPDDVDAVVTYRDKWYWDLSMYMLALSIKIRDPDTDFPLAEGNSLHTSLARKTPEAMVTEVLSNIFGEHQSN